jgi:soluble lytic murein transglycosylase-like protein
MATLTITAPVVAPVVLTSPTTWYSTREGLKKEMIKTWTNYGSYFKKFAETSKVPAEILLAFTQVESGGNATAGGSGSLTQGLMQWNRIYAGGTGNSDYVLTKEFNKGRLSQVEKDTLAKYNIKFDAKGNTRAITQADLVKPELNILVGSIILGQYIDETWGTDIDGKIRMDRIIAKYNWGIGGFKKNGLATKDLQGVLANIPAVTKTYIQKMLGKNGALDIAINDKIMV